MENRNGLIIIVLSILFVIVMMIPITGLLISPREAEPLNTPIFELGNDTLNEFFDTNTIPALDNLITNGDFSDVTTGWQSASDGIISVTEGILEIAHQPADIVSAITCSITQQQSGVFYLKYKGKTIDGTLSLRANFNPIPNTGISSTTFKDFSIGVSLIDVTSFQIYNISSNEQSGFVDYIMSFNLTDSHGVTETSGTAYDRAVADYEDTLTFYGGYFEGSQYSPWLKGFELGLTNERIDYYYGLYLYYLSL